MTDRFRDRLSEYRDGELAPGEEALIERHLEDCGECSQTLAELQAVADRAADLDDRVPERDLWNGIAARIEPRLGTLPVKDEATASIGVLSFARRVTFTIPQLAAAAVALATLSTAGAWFALGGTSGSSAVGSVAETGPVDGSALVSTQTGDEAALAEQYGSVISNLETALFDSSSPLPPDTEASLRRALLKIDRAIEDAEKALEALPGDSYLEEHVENTMRRKTDFLRRAVRLSQG
jgi:anti-sigma factor RsiW